jgi:uncharacterized NAD(P)/FAD-binding protein YdhS
MRIGIIGGGLTGTLAAIYLQKENIDAEITIYEQNPAIIHRGIPYSHQLEYQPLNVNARGMTLFDEEPLHFFNWWKNNFSKYQDYKNHVPSESDFVKRSIYGDYLKETFEKTFSAGNSRIKIIHGEVVDIIKNTEDDFLVKIQDGDVHVADKILLALGNFPPADPTFIRSTDIINDPDYISHPWRDNAIDNLEQNDTVLFVGSGLTMIDLAVSLKKRNHKGKLHVISRRGLLPFPHQPGLHYKLSTADFTYKTALELFKAVREEIRIAGNDGVNWRDVIDSLRPITQKIWSGLPAPEKRTFLAHIRPYWDVMRHRMPPESYVQVTEMIDSGMMEIYAGRIRKVIRDNENLIIEYLPKGETTEKNISVKRIINCTGPQSDYRKLSTPLVLNLFSKGWIIPDDQFLGLKTDLVGKIIDREGNTSRPFYSAGPPCKGTLWECTALRDIRLQIKQLIPLLAESI